MFIIIGGVVVLGSVIGGFLMHHGPLAVLIQWNEFLIIGGAAIGSMLVSMPVPMIKQLLGNIGALFKGDPYTKEEYLNLLKTMFELFNVAKRDGLINVEPHIENPQQSAIFTKNPFLLANHHALNYFCDTMRLLLGGGVPPYDLEALLDADTETHHIKSASLTGVLGKTADSMPGLGIVAAVLGIIITMGKINGPPEEIGFSVAAALVGTFIGILLCYGFVNPIATHMDLLSQSQSRYYECIKSGVLAYSKGTAPVMVVEFARRVVFDDVRPSFLEVEKAMKEIKSQS